MQPSTPSKAEIRKRILEGNQRRHEEAKKQREFERELQEEVEEAKVMERGDISKFVSNILISIVFISMPLTEPTIDWIQVAVFAGANLVWNVFFHRHTLVHYMSFLMINILLVQWTHEIYNIPRWVASVPPLQGGLFLAGNAAVAAGFYFLYVDKVVKRREREERLDVAMASVLTLNIVALVIAGVIPLSLLYEAFKSITRLVS